MARSSTASSGGVTGTKRSKLKGTYILRPRYHLNYHPNWPRYYPNRRPSWKRSGKDFFAAEDGQPTLVSVVCLAFTIVTFFLVADSDGRNARVGRETGHV